MVDYKYKDLFLKRNIEKKLKIATDDGLFVATSSDIAWENFELTESLCSESELRFGSCEASMVKFQIRNAFIPLIGKWLNITETLDGNTDAPFQYGRYKVFSDKPTADREYRDITAYDAMYDILGADVAAWYNSILPTKESRVTLKQFRKSFVRYFGLTEVVPEGGLVNDEMIVEKTIDIVASSESESETSQTSVIGEALSGRDVITAICEINGCFGHVGRDGKFHYIYLPQGIEGLYPADDLFPSNTLYPREPKGTRVGSGTYINVKWEDFNVRSITKLQIRQEENDIGKIWPETPPSANDNCYIIQGNFLVYGKSSDELKVIAQNILGKIAHITYMPLELCEAMGNPWLEVGDPIRLSTKYALIETYILERTLKGIQALRDTYKANGVQQYAEKVNSVHRSILQLKGKSNVLERTIEITRLEMKDLGAGLSTEISITAGQIRTELQNTKEGLETTITTTAAGIRADVSKTYETKTNASAEYTSIRSSISVEAGRISSEIERATKAEKNLSGEISSTTTTLTSKIEQTESSIISTVSATYETKTNASREYTTIKSSVQQNANSISAEVTRASSAEGTLSTRITATENGLTTKVSKGNISSEISQEAGQISISANRFVLSSTNCSIAADGTITAKNVNITGKIVATAGGTIGGFTIGSSSIYKTTNSMSSTSAGVYLGTDGANWGGKAKITSAGKATFSDIEITGNGSVAFSYGAGKMELNYKGIKFGTGSSYNVQINDEEISVYTTKLNRDGFRVGHTSIAYTEMTWDRITAYSTTTDYIKIGSRWAEVPRGGYSIKYGSHVLLDVSANFSKLLGNTASLGEPSGKISFFGAADPANTKQSVPNISSTSSATASSVASKLNDLLNALRSYNLIG